MGAERRQFPRIPQVFEVHYRRIGELGATWRQVQTLNLSAGGVRFRDTESLEVGERLEIRIQLPGVREVLILCGGVAWSQFEASGVSETGVEFIEATERERQAIDNLVQFLRKSEPSTGPSS